MKTETALSVNDTSKENDRMQSRIISTMTEGVMAIGFDGTILFANSAVLAILGFSENDIIGKKFASLFFENPENDAFAQSVLDAVEDKQQPHYSMVRYSYGGQIKHLRVVTSFLSGDEKTTGITIVIDDLSELEGLRDSLRAMEQINELNAQLQMRNDLLNRTFGLFLSDEIVRQLLDTPNGLTLGGKKKRVAIMMSDLRGFTAISERMDPADTIAMLNHYLGAMTEVIQKRGGTIIEFIGDGIMAIFGAPVCREGFASDAVAAGLEMEAAMEEVNRWNAERDYPLLEMGIGLHIGDVIVGNIGSEKRMKYGIVGSDVNLCGRIESYTVGGQILISPQLRESVKSPLKIASEMTVFPKGTDHELVLSHITGIGAPYNVYTSIMRDVPKELASPLAVCFYRINEKHKNTKTCYGGIVSVGRNSAVLETQTELELYDNIQLQAGGQLFCKVQGKDADSYVLHYTSIPSGYEKWLKGAVT